MRIWGLVAICVCGLSMGLGLGYGWGRASGAAARSVDVRFITMPDVQTATVVGVFPKPGSNGKEYEAHVRLHPAFGGRGLTVRMDPALMPALVKQIRSRAERGCPFGLAPEGAAAPASLAAGK